MKNPTKTTEHLAGPDSFAERTECHTPAFWSGILSIACLWCPGATVIRRPGTAGAHSSPPVGESMAPSQAAPLRCDASAPRGSSAGFRAGSWARSPPSPGRARMPPKMRKSQRELPRMDAPARAQRPPARPIGAQARNRRRGGLPRPSSRSSSPPCASPDRSLASMVGPFGGRYPFRLPPVGFGWAANGDRGSSVGLARSSERSLTEAARLSAR